MSLAIFDLDNTLLGGDSDHAWGEFLVNIGAVDKASYQRGNDYFYQQYQQGGLNIDEFLAFALKPLADNDKQQLDNWHQQFMTEMIAPMMLPKAQQLLQQHRERGDYLLIITATNEFVTAPIGRLLGVDDLLATVPEYINGAFTGKVAGTPCFHAGKVERLRHWLDENPHSLEDSYFYSDSHNDLPLLELVDHPVAVDADAILTAHAQQQGWPIMSLRD